MVKMLTIKALAIASLVALSSGAGYAALNDTLQLRFSDDTQLQLGVGVDEAEPGAARQFCLQAAPSDTINDVGGATSASITTTGVFSLKDVENDFNFDYSVETTASASVGKLFSADATLRNAGKYQLFLKRHKNSIGLTIEAHSRHGSKRINYAMGLKPAFQKMIDEKRFEAFRKACGTHFVASHSLVSQLTVILNAADLSKTVKTSLAQNWAATVGAKATFKIVGASAKVKTTGALSNLLTVAKRHGTITFDVKSRGGAGIASIGQVMAGVSFTPDDVPKIYEAIANAAKDFTQERAEPETFNLIGYEIFGARPATLTAATVDGMNAIYKRVMRVDAVLQIYKDYQQSRNALFEAHFRPTFEALTGYRRELVSLYRGCRAGQDCTLPPTAKLNRVLFLEDIFENAQFEVSCVHGHKINGVNGTSRNFISSADFVVRGRMRFLKEWDKQAIQVLRYDDEGQLAVVAFDPVERIRLFNKDEAGADVIIQLDTAQLLREKLTNATGQADIPQIAALRNSLRERAFVLRVPFHNTFAVDEVFALPQMRDCPIAID